jgi:hypothetical protein
VESAWWDDGSQLEHRSADIKIPVYIQQLRLAEQHVDALAGIRTHCRERRAVSPVRRGSQGERYEAGRFGMLSENAERWRRICSRLVSAGVRRRVLAMRIALNAAQSLDLEKNFDEGNPVW